MKKANKPSRATPAPKALATKKSSAKSTSAKKPSTKAKPRKAQGQAELLPILERLAQSAERLAQTAERLTEATLRKSHERQDEAFKTLGESIADVTASEESQEPAEPVDLTTSEEHAEMANGTKDR